MLTAGREIVGHSGRDGSGRANYKAVPLATEDLEKGPAEAAQGSKHIAHVPLYQVWKGNNNFWCEGKCATGPEPLHLLFTVTLISFPIILSSVYILPLVVSNHAAWILLPTLALIPLTFFYLFKSSCTEPGILPRQTPENADIPPDASRAKRDLVINGVAVTSKWCSTCLLFRPPRCKHCVYCDNCVLKFDHHCPWVSNCVGLRNYRYFVCFVFSLTLLTCYLLGLDILGVVDLTRTRAAEKRAAGARHHVVSPEVLVETMITHPMLTFVICFLTCVSCPLINLSLFHCYLVAKNLTTNEEIKELYQDANPFSRGFIGNCKQAMTDSVEPSRVQWRQLVPVSSAEEPSLIGQSYEEPIWMGQDETEGEESKRSRRSKESLL
eukprot:GHVS01039845.1.p1 GENE.GHVS01039845.1~~GHVS01039845.1.p1  ORF type:complete len:381 (-),score=15.55 GHVS01039845.1:440-1582(-)